MHFMPVLIVLLTLNYVKMMHMSSNSKLKHHFSPSSLISSELPHQKHKVRDKYTHLLPKEWYNSYKIGKTIKLMCY